MTSSEFNQRTFSASLIVSGIALTAILLYAAQYVVLMSLIGIGLGALVSPLLTQMREKFKLPRALSALIFLALAVVLSAFVFYAIGFLVTDQINNLTERAPQLISNLKTLIQKLSEQYPWVRESLQSFDVEEGFKKGASHIAYGVRSGFALAGGIGFAIVIALYTSVGAKEYVNSFLTLFPASKRERVRIVLNVCAQNLRRWSRAQLIDMLIIGLITMVGLWAVGAEYWAVFGLLTAIFGLIPYLGIIIVIGIATLVTLASDPSMVPWVLGVFLLTQQIEGNIVLPMVMKGQVELPEMPLLIFMLFMGTWFGLLGAFLATPFFAVLRTLYLELYLPAMNKK